MQSHMPHNYHVVLAAFWFAQACVNTQAAAFLGKPLVSFNSHAAMRAMDDWSSGRGFGLKGDYLQVASQSTPARPTATWSSSRRDEQGRPRRRVTSVLSIGSLS